MREPEHALVVAILGQWASGKSTASRTLIEHLGGEEEVVFLNDQHLLADLVIAQMLALDPGRVATSVEEDGRRRLEAEHATIWLLPGEDLRTLDRAKLVWRIPEGAEAVWLERARAELVRQIRDRRGMGKPVVVEAGFGAHPDGHTVADLLKTLEEEGVAPTRIKWLIIEAGFEKREERNVKRGPYVPPTVFARLAVDGGDLDPDHQKRLELQGTSIQRVPNVHDDVERFRAGVVDAFEVMV